MRNEMQPYQQQLNNSIERTRALMQQFKGMGNKEMVISNLLQQYPQLGQLLNMTKNGVSLETIASNMAQMRGFNINEIIQRLLNT